MEWNCLGCKFFLTRTIYVKNCNDPMADISLIRTIYVKNCNDPIADISLIRTIYVKNCNDPVANIYVENCKFFSAHVLLGKGFHTLIIKDVLFSLPNQCGTSQSTPPPSRPSVLAGTPPRVHPPLGNNLLAGTSPAVWL